MQSDKNRSIIGLISIFIIVYFASTIIVGGLVSFIGNLISGGVAEFTTCVSFWAVAISWVFTILIIWLLSSNLEIKLPSLKPEIGKINSPLLIIGLILIIAIQVVIDPVIKLIPDIGMELLNEVMVSGLWGILAATVVAPLAEEYYFRGIVQKNLTERAGAIQGVIISSLMFGFVHLIPQQAFYAASIGLIIGGIYYITKSLSTVIILHFLNNGLAYMTSVFFAEELDLDKFKGTTVHIIIYAVSVILITLAVWSFLKTVKKRQHQNQIANESVNGSVNYNSQTDNETHSTNNSDF